MEWSSKWQCVACLASPAQLVKCCTVGSSQCMLELWCPQELCAMKRCTENCDWSCYRTVIHWSTVLVCIHSEHGFSVELVKTVNIWCIKNPSWTEPLLNTDTIDIFNLNCEINDNPISSHTIRWPSMYHQLKSTVLEDVSLTIKLVLLAGSVFQRRIFALLFLPSTPS
jgi:hypothetical protein